MAIYLSLKCLNMYSKILMRLLYIDIAHEAFGSNGKNFFSPYW